jgi:protoporphyrinogen oxidase
MREHIERNGGTLRTESPVRRLLVDGDRVTGVGLADGSELRADHVVSSMPITLLLKGMPNVPDHVTVAASRLRFRNTILVYLRVEDPDLFPDQWLYVHDQSVLHGRVTNFRNWSPDIAGDDDESVLCLEFWCFDEDAIWSEDDELLVDRAREEIVHTGLAKDVMIREGAVIRIPRCYPVYERGYQEPLKIVTDWLDGIKGLTAIGRYGSFKYNNQDHSILMGIMAGESIAAGRPTALWNVNTGTTYQESASSDGLRG